MGAGVGWCGMAWEGREGHGEGRGTAMEQPRDGQGRYGCELGLFVGDAHRRLSLCRREPSAQK